VTRWQRFREWLCGRLGWRLIREEHYWELRQTIAEHEYSTYQEQRDREYHQLAAEVTRLRAENAKLRRGVVHETTNAI
jgi:cell division protein FtsB